MTKVKNYKWSFILAFILTVIFINSPVVYTYFYHSITGAPEASKATMDLSYIDSIDEKIYLDGQWEFYWKKFIVTDSEKIVKPDLIMRVPDEWSRYKINDKKLPAIGFGSYKLTITGIKHDNNVSLFIPDYGGAYRIFINGKLTAESGVVSKNIDKVYTVPKAKLYPLKLLAGKSHEIVIEVATSKFSGLYITPILSDYNKLLYENKIKNAIWYMLFGIALFSFFSLIAMYILVVRRKLHFFWMPVIILFILIRIMLTSEFYSLWQSTLFFGMSYESTNELMYLTTFVLKYLLIFFVQEQCGIIFSKKGKIGFLIYYVFLYLIYILMPKDIYNNYLSVYIPMLTYVLDIYMLIKIYLNRNKLKKFGFVVLICVILIISGIAIDSYYINGKIYIDMSMTLLILFTVFLLIMSCIYLIRSFDLEDDFAISSSRLELANRQIAIQNEYYNTLRGQIDEIREIKHDIHHFIGVMSSLANEGEFDKLEIFLNEYSEKVKKEQLPVFCENVVVNSIIGYYYIQAKKYGIDFKSRCKVDNQIAISDSDICIVLGNAFENAIDACRQMDTSEIRFVSVEVRTMKGQLLLKVKNSYNGSLEIRDGKFISAKGGKSHGIGIINIKKVMESYGAFLKIKYDEKEFTLMTAVPEI